MPFPAEGHFYCSKNHTFRLYLNEKQFIFILRRMNKLRQTLHCHSFNYILPTENDVAFEILRCEEIADFD